MGRGRGSHSAAAAASIKARGERVQLTQNADGGEWECGTHVRATQTPACARGVVWVEQHRARGATGLPDEKQCAVFSTLGVHFARASGAVLKKVKKKSERPSSRGGARVNKNRGTGKNWTDEEGVFLTGRSSLCRVRQHTPALGPLVAPAKKKPNAMAACEVARCVARQHTWQASHGASCSEISRPRQKQIAVSGYSALTHTRHDTRRVPGSAKRRFCSRDCDIVAHTHLLADSCHSQPECSAGRSGSSCERITPPSAVAVLTHPLAQRTRTWPARVGVFWGGLQAPFRPALAHRLLLSAPTAAIA